MRVMIKGVTPLSNISTLACDGRFFPTTGEGHLVEVLEQKDSTVPPVMIDVLNSTTQKMVPTPRPDPDRMGRDALEAIAKDGRFQIMQLDTVDARASAAVVDTMRSEVIRLTGENADLKIDVARAEAAAENMTRDMEALKVEVAALTAEVEDLEKELEAATAPSRAPAPDATTGGPPSSPPTTTPSAK